MRRGVTQAARAGAALLRLHNTATAAAAVGARCQHACQAVPPPLSQQCAAVAATAHRPLVLQRQQQQQCHVAGRRRFATAAGDDGRRKEERPHERAPVSKGFLHNLVDNIKTEINHNKELEENKKRLREEMARLNESDTLKEARRKYQMVERETVASTERLRRQMADYRGQITEYMADVRTTEYGRRLSAAGERLVTVSRDTAEQIGRAAEAVGDAPGVKQVAATVKLVQTEINEVTLGEARMYRAPDTLRMRSDLGGMQAAFATRSVDVNETASELQLHKDSQWYESWRRFADNNPVYNRVLDWKMRFDESEGRAARLARGIADRLYTVLGHRSEISQALTEIVRADAAFDRDEFMRYMEGDMVPNVLEAIVRADFAVLKDWCHERAYMQVTGPMSESIKLGYRYESKILDTSRCELVTAKMMEQGPVLVVSFTAHAIMCLRNSTGKVIEGSADEPVRLQHVWAVCRDMDEPDALAAWKVLEIHWNKL